MVLILRACYKSVVCMVSPARPSACLDLVYCLLQIMFRCSVTHLGTGCSVHFLLCVSQEADGSTWGSFLAYWFRRKRNHQESSRYVGCSPHCCWVCPSEQGFRQWPCGATVLRGGRAQWPQQQPWSPPRPGQVLAPIGESLPSVLDLPLPHKLN